MKLFEEGGIDIELCLAALRRPKADLSLEYLCELLQDIESGKVRNLTREGLHDLLKDPCGQHPRCTINDYAPPDTFAKFLAATTTKEEGGGGGGGEVGDFSSVLESPSFADFSMSFSEMSEDDVEESSNDYGNDDDDDDDNDAAEEDEGDGDDEGTLLWRPTCFPLPPLCGHSIFYTVFFRVNGAHYLFNTINLSKNRVLDRKVYRFKEAHLRLVQFLDACGNDVSDEHLQAAGLFKNFYCPLGDARYSQDRKYMRVTVQRHKCKATPLEVIQKEYPRSMWTVEEVAVAIEKRTIDWESLAFRVDDEWCPLGPSAPPVETHILYYAVVYILNQCQRHLDEPFRREGRGGPVYDALWAYYASFMELFEFCCSQEHVRMDDFFLRTPIGSELGRMGNFQSSDQATPWELYGTALDDRTFHAGDLPDLYHVLMSIPLWGEQQTPPYFLGKIYHKSLPFACQRRHLIKRVVECVEKSDAFWKIFSKLTWVMLAGLYPGDLGSFNTSYIGMRDLLRAKELTDEKEVLLKALTASTSASGGGPLVVFTIFSLHILYMASFNPQYENQARRCIDWDNFKRDVIHLADIIRSTKLFSTDPFAQARMQLNKTVKSPNTHVHRLRKRSLQVTLMKHCNEHLEKTLLKDKQNLAADLPRLQAIIQAAAAASFLSEELEAQFFATRLGAWSEANNDGEDARPVPVARVEQALRVCERARAFYSQLLGRTHFKAPILNTLIRMPPEERMTLNAFSMLRLEAYGAVCEETVQLMDALVKIYHHKAAPKDFRARIGSMRVKDFMVVCFYFNMAALLEKISFVPLDAETTRRTDQAMMARRQRLYPGETVPRSMYEISVALCCERVCTLMGTGKYGTKKVAYNIERQSFVCTHGKKLTSRIRLNQAGQEEEDEDNDDDDDDEDDDDDNDGEKDEEIDGTASLLRAQNDNELDFNMSHLHINNLIADATTMRGKGKRRTQAKQDSKAIRNERKAWSKIPCGQPVLHINLRGRAMVWGNTLEDKTLYMFCPECAAPHIFSMLNFAGSETGHYRCNECARKELMHVQHRSCAYCGQSSPGQIPEENKLSVLCIGEKDPTDPNFVVEEQPANVQQWLYFCRTHYRIVKNLSSRGRVIPKDELWAMIRKVQSYNMMRVARGDFNRKK